MPTIIEGNLTFTFPNAWVAEHYDVWVFFLQEFQNVCGGAKAVDMVAAEPAVCCWLIEVKDYRLGHQTTALAVADVVAQKFRDTLAGLATARVRAAGGEQHAAGAVLDCPDLRLVFHMEQPPAASPLFPTAISRANVVQRLRQLKMQKIDPNFRVVDVAGAGNLPWTVI